MGAANVVLWIGIALGATASPDALGQALQPAGRSPTLVQGQSYLGLQLGGTRADAACEDTSLTCRRPLSSAQVTAGRMFGPHWGAEVSYVDWGRVPRLGGETQAQGLNVSVVGRAAVLPSVNVFGKVGTTYGRTDTTSPLGNLATGGEQGFGLSFGAGVSYDITPRLSATLEVDSHDLRFAGGTRDPVRGANLGLRWRY